MANPNVACIALSVRADVAKTGGRSGLVLLASLPLGDEMVSDKDAHDWTVLSMMR